jgi:uncharacterized small protein (DUF1192 family)
MQKALLFLLTLVAAALLVTQASAWWGGPHMTGYGGPAYTANQAPGAANGDIAEIRAEIASLQAKLNRELAQDNVNLDRVRELNQRIGQTQRELRSAASRRGRGYGGGSGHRHGGHRMAGHGPCW